MHVAGLKNGVLQALALHAPGGLRTPIHRLRGVKIGEGTFVAVGVIIDTYRPEMVSIGKGAYVGIRATIIAHFRGSTPAERREGAHRFSVLIEDDAFIGPGVIILPGVTVGYGAVVTAGSVVTSSVPALTMVQGNPARPVARCGVPLAPETISLREFYRKLAPLT